MQRRRPYLLHEAAKTTSLAKGVDNMKRHTKEELTLWCESKDEPVPGSMARRANKAGSVYDVSELMKSDQLNPWTMAKLKESYLEARHGKDQRKCIVQQVIQRNTNILRRIIAPGHTCACAVACLCPHNSISNVMSLMIHDKTYVYIYYI